MYTHYALYSKLMKDMWKINFPEMGSNPAGRDKERWKLQNSAYGHIQEINSFFWDLSNHLSTYSWQLPCYPLAPSSKKKNMACSDTNQENCVVRNTRNKPTSKQLPQCCCFNLQKVFRGFLRKENEVWEFSWLTFALLGGFQPFQERRRTAKTSCTQVAKESRQTTYSWASKKVTLWARGFHWKSTETQSPKKPVCIILLVSGTLVAWKGYSPN